MQGGKFGQGTSVLFIRDCLGQTLPTQQFVV
jgi:hypothetical protein